MRSFSLICALAAVSATPTFAAPTSENMLAWTGGPLENAGKSLTAAGYTDWTLEGEGENQQMKQELVQTLTWDTETDELEVGELLQVYNIQPNADGDRISCSIWRFEKLPTGAYNIVN